LPSQSGRLTVTVTALVVLNPPASVMVTRKLYVPVAVRGAAVCFAVLVRLWLKLTGAGGVPVVVQVDARFDSPPSSAPRTLRTVFAPVTGLGDADAAVATVGFWFTCTPVNVAVQSVPLAWLVTAKPARAALLIEIVWPAPTWIQSEADGVPGVVA